MATTKAKAQLLLDATSPRIVAVALPGNLTADWSTQVTGSGKPSDNATRNIVTYSGTEPSSPANGDIWVETDVSPVVIRMRVSGAWQTSASYTTNTNQLTDGAGLGTKATWANITGAGKPADGADVTTSILGASGTSIVMTSSNLFKSGSGLGGVFIGSGGLVGKNTSGVTTFSIDGATGAAEFKGSITGGANINITGQALFGGAYSVGGSTFAVVANSSGGSGSGVYGAAASGGKHGVYGAGAGGSSTGVTGYNTSGVGVDGYAASSGGVGVVGTGATSGSIGVKAVSSSGTALAVEGTMTINNDTLVSNLNAEKCNGVKLSVSITSGSATATLSANKPGSNSNAVWMPVVIAGSNYYIPVWS